MSYLIYNKITGEIRQTGEAPEDVILLMVDAETEDYLLESANDSLEYIDVNTKNKVTKAPCPSSCHDWDWGSKTWIPNIARAKSFIKSKIDIARYTAERQPLSYDAKILDADDLAINNLSGKITAINARNSLNIPLDPNLLVWRDYENITHTWGNGITYKNWLDGYVVALEERKTALYIQSWQKKAEVDNLENINDILNYNITFT